MTSIVQTTDIIGTGRAVTFGSGSPQITSGDLFYLTEGTRIISSNSEAFYAHLVGASFSYDWNIDGFVYGNGKAIYAYTNTDSADLDLKLTVGATGTLSSQTSYGIYMGSDGATSTGSINISNAGTIQSADGAGMFLFGVPEITISNSGSIRSNGDDTSWNNGIYLYNADQGSITNSGLIENIATTGSSSGATIDDFAAVGVRSGGAGSDFTITNTGTIHGGSHSVYMSTETSRLNNFGLLNGDVFFDNATGTGIINNSGSILGDVTLDTATDTVINSGTVSGAILMKGGNDTFDGRGGHVGDSVSGGTGDDTFIIDDATIVLNEYQAQGTDTVQSTVGWKLGDNFENLTLLGDGNIRGIGNSEVNTLTGNIGDNRLRGKGGNDIINGGEGDDKAWGAAGLETIHGDDGDDILHGGLNDDVIYGDNDNDVLYGNRNNDTLYGGNGADRLIGGLGRDTFYGGEGEDEFVFNRKNDSTDTVDADKISDFVIGEDVIDLSGLAGSLNYIGTAGFSGAVGEVQAIGSGGTTRVKIDLDGDGTADMKIMVVGTVGLTEADFLL